MADSAVVARIAVIGAGPGLTLAKLLQRNGIAVTVYEHDRGPDDRPQGGTLDMHAGSGQAALAAAGLLDQFLAASRPEARTTDFSTAPAPLSFESISPDGEISNPEIDRGDLRALLLGSLAPDTVAWGSHLDTVSPTGQGTYRLEFDDGNTDVDVGADGAWSRVRPLVSADVPLYSGVTFVEIVIRDVDDAHPDLAALVGRGTRPTSCRPSVARAPTSPCWTAPTSLRRSRPSRTSTPRSAATGR